jgi:hypothetical protein
VSDQRARPVSGASAFPPRLIAAILIGAAACVLLTGAIWAGTQRNQGRAPAVMAFSIDGMPELLPTWQTAVARALAQAPVGADSASVRAAVFAESRRGLAVLHQAALQGLTPSGRDVGNLLALQRKMVLARADGAARVHGAALALGLSDDEYWAQARAGFAQALAVARLRARFAQHHPGSQEAVEQGWQRYEDTLGAAARVQSASVDVTLLAATLKGPS